MNDPHRDVIRTRGTMVGRMLMGFLFFASGLNILFMQGIGNTADYFESVSIPLAGLAVWLVILVKVVAGGALMLGYRSGLAASALILFTFGATYFGYWNLQDPGLFKNLALIGGLIYVLAYGPGDGWRVGKEESSGAHSSSQPQSDSQSVGV